jgi:transcriptional regulator with XRE-family HTH domain
MFLVSNREVFSNWLQKELAKRDWSQADLSKRSGLHRAIISKVLLGSSMPTPETLESIARGLGMSPETVYRAAGLLPSQPEADEMVEKLNYKITQLTPGARALAEKLLDALLEEDKPKTVNVGKRVKQNR